ncbi:MAG: cadherin-like domain-containing protein [Betaproteobacteria bacterium]|nr:cadherin-like domain-containing protein [Betaproteobacteria bacterium]
MNSIEYKREINFNIGTVSINVVENDGNLDFTVSSLDGDDLRGLFFDFNNTSLLSSLVLTGVNINNSDIEDEGVINLKQGVNLQGTGLLFDIGIAFGTAGSGTDIIQQTEFTLSSTANVLTLDDIANVEFGVRTTSEGDKLTAIAPAAPDAKSDAYDIFEDGQPGLTSPSHTSLATKFEVLANDTDADGDILTIIDVRGALHGTVTIVDGDDADSLPGDAVEYTPDTDYSGADSFEYLTCNSPWSCHGEHSSLCF